MRCQFIFWSNMEENNVIATCKIIDGDLMITACQSLYCFVHNLIKIIRIKPQRILMYL